MKAVKASPETGLLFSRPYIGKNVFVTEYLYDKGTGFVIKIPWGHNNKIVLTNVMKIVMIVSVRMF
jgi:hypothetical protein